MKNFNSFMWLRGYGLKRVGRILACLTLLLTLVCGNVWGAETVLFNSFSSTTKGDYFKNYTVDSKTVTVATDLSIASSSGDYYVSMGSTPSNNASNYIELSVTSATIKTVSVLITGNGSDKTCQPALLGWEGAIADNATADYVLVPSSRSISNKGLSNAEWHQFDVHGNDLTRVRIYRAVKGVDVAGESTSKTTYGNAQSLQFYGIRVELESGSSTYTVTYNGNGNTSGSVPVDSDSPYEKDATVTVLGNSGTLAKTGFIFNGWNTSNDGSGIHYDADDTFTMGTANVTLYAEWAYPATGTGTVTYALSGSTTTGTVTGVSTINSLSSSFTTSTLSISSTKSGYTGDIVGTPSSFSSTAYLDVQFTIADGYQFNPSSITVQANPLNNTGALMAKVEILDGTTTVASNELSCSKSTDNTVTFASGAFTGKNFKGTTHLRIYFWGPASDKKFYVKSPLTITGTVAAAGCSGFDFHYGTDDQDDWTVDCFVDTESDHIWQLTSFTIPTVPNFWVGYAGSAMDNDKTVGHAWSDAPADLGNGVINGAMLLVPIVNNNGVGHAQGATGKLEIYDNSDSKNQYVRFTPDGYGITYDGSGHAFNTTLTSNMYETDVVTLPNVSNTYNIGLKTATDNTFVKFGRSKSTDEAISAIGKTILDGGKKKILLDPGSFAADDAVYAVWDCTNSAWGDGTTKLFTDADGDGVWECPVASNCANIILVRLSSGTDASNIDWSRKWNQTNGTSTIGVGDLLNKYTITSLNNDDCAYSTTAMHPATGDKGKFRMWNNSADLNYYTHWIPYYVLTYDANGGSGTTAQTERNTESSTTTVTVASNGFTAPTGYSFSTWKTEPSSGTSYAPEASYTLSADATLYAQWSPIEYTITLAKGEHGAADQSATVDYDATVVKSITPVISTGYTLDGYYDGETKVLNANGTFAGSNITGYITSGKWSKADNCELTAKWSVQTYNITYYDGGGSDAITFTGNHMPSYPTTHTYDAATTLKKASKAGYVFGGWFKEYGMTNNTNLSIGATDRTANFNLYAKWTAMSMVDLADVTLYKASDMVPDGLTISSTEYYYPGVSADQRFNLVGSGTSDASSGPMGAKTMSSTEVDDTSFDEYLDFCGAASVTSYVPSSRGLQFKVSAAGKLVIYCKNPKVLYLSNGSGETQLDADETGAAKIVKTISAGTYYLYAKNTGAELYGLQLTNTYTVTYNKNNGSATGTVPSDASSPYDSGSRVVVKGPGDLALEDNIFVGWNDKSDGSGNYYSEKSNFAISENKTLYAQWRSTSSTTCPDGSSEGTVFSLAGKDNSGGSAKNLRYGEAVDLSAYATITNGAASLTDIRTSSGDTKATITKANPAAVQLVGNDAMLTLYMDCELAEGDVISYTSSESVELCFTTSPTRATTISTSSKSYPIPAESPLIGTRLLYVWRATSSTVSITELTITRPMSNHTITGAVSPAGYGSVSPASISVADGSTVSISDNVLTCDGKTLTATAAVATAEYTYTFDSWSGVADEDEITSDVTATAVFTRTANDYSLAWSTNGGSDLAGTPTSGTVAYGTTLTKPTDPTRSGYDFDGWFTNNDGTGTEVGSTMPAANTTYYAKWTQTVTLDANTDNGGDEDGSATATINGTALSSVSHATGVTGYKLTGYFTAATGGTKVLNANGTFAATSVTDYITDGKWTKSGATTLYAQWEEGCIERSLSKVVLTSASAGTVTGYNFGEYAGDAVIEGLKSTQTAEVDDTKGGNETGYKLNSSSAIVFATLKKGTFQEGDQVKVTITYQNDNYSFPSPVSAKTGMDIYYGTNASDATLLTTLSGVDAAGTYSYTLTSSDISAIGSKVGIGVLRHADRPQNQYVYSVEIVGCREYKTEYTVTYDGNGEDSGEEPVDTKTYEYKDQVTVLGNTGNLTKTGYTFRGWTDGTTFYRAGDKLTMKADDVTLKTVWESNSGTETIALTYFEGTNYGTSSSKPDGLNKYLYGYKSSTLTAANALTITTDGGTNIKGYNSNVVLRLDYNQKIRIYADNATTDRVATGFTGVSSISFKWMFIASGSSGKTELTSSYTVKVGATTVADAVSITGKTNDGYATVNITGIEDLDGYVEIYFGGSSSSYNVYLDDIAITYDPYVDVTYDNMTGFAGTATMPGDIVGVPVESKINRPADPTTEDDYVFSGWYKEAACSNAWDFASDKVTSNTTLYAKWIASDYTITWMVGDDEEPYAETKALAGVSLTSIPTPPADNTIGECANSFRGWSETNLYGEATSTQPADLFIDAAGAPIISANKTFYAVFGTATTAAYAGTVLWSENWTGASNNDKPTGPTESGSVVYRNPTIEYRWECGKDSEGTDGTQSRVSTGTGGATGGSTPDALIGSKTGAGGTGGYLLVDGIPVGGAKTVTVQYVKNGNSVDVSYYLDGVYSNHNSVTSATSGSFDIDCSGKSILKLKFEATTTSNVRLDNIVVKIKEDGATDYRCICPELTLVGPSADLVFVTSTAEKTVRSQEAFTVSGKGLTKSTALTAGNFDNSKFAFKTATGGTVSTDANGDLEETSVYVFYTPDAEDDTDGLDEATEVTISIEGAGAATSNDLYGTKRVIGRHLPAEFVIAAKRNNKWYALPSNMASTTNPKPAEIAVNDISNPSIAYTATSNIYSLVGPTASNISGGKGDYIRFVMMPLWVDDSDHSKGHAPLFGRATGENTIGKSGNSQATSDLESGGWWWKLVQTNTSITNPQDAKYTIYNHNNTSSLSLRENAGNPDWGLFASGVEELRLIPASDIVFTEAEVVEWGQHGAIIEVNATAATGVDATSVIAHLGAASSSAITLSETKTSVKGGDTKYNYTVNFGDVIDFAAAASNGAMLTLEWKKDAAVKAMSNIVVPKIIASSATMSSLMATDDPWSKAEVHVLPGVTLTANAGDFSSKDVVVDRLEIYPGATVKVTKGAQDVGTLKVKTLVLRNGWTRAGEKAYDVARMYVSADANLAKNAGGDVWYSDWYIDYDQYYPIAVPFPVATSGICYKNTKQTATAGVRLGYYSGELRATNIQQNQADNWVEYNWNGSDPAMPTNLEPSKGYIMTAKRPTGKAFSIVRMPMTFSNDWTALGEQGVVSGTHKDQVTVTAWGNENTPSYAKGWNMIANPYMALHEGALSYDDESGDEIQYANIPDVSFKEYDQLPIDATELKPASAFLIQAPKDGTVTFGAANRKASAPSYRKEEAPKPSKQKAYIVLGNEEANDMMGLIISDRYTAEYEINADLEKLLGDGTSLKTYMHYGDRSMAYVAINQTLAQEWIPVSVRLPQTGEYTFSLHDASKVGELEGLYLIDYTSNEITNLIEDSYTFVAEAGTISNRFAINATIGERQTPTAIDVIGADKNGDWPIKFLYRDKVYIWHKGNIYDATGKKVREINK